MWYLTLSDDESHILCTVRKSVFEEFTEEFTTGLEVIVDGNLTVYVPEGQLQLQITSMRIEGPGERRFRLEKLRIELEEAGYFAEDHKRELPEDFKTVAVVTSPTGAVIHDIETTLKNSQVPFKVRIYPTQMQGRGTEAAVVRAIKFINEEALSDVIIVARGGGSNESLAVFNSRKIVEAVFCSGIPVIAAIGHETNSSFTDLAADFSSITPTAAAELLVNTWYQRQEAARRRAQLIFIVKVIAWLGFLLVLLVLVIYLKNYFSNMW